MLVKYIISTSLILILTSCVSIRNVSVQNTEFDSFKNSADHKDCNGESKKIGKYTLINNRWGEDKIKSGTYEQCVYHKDGMFGWEWSAPEKSYGVIGYPELWLGVSAWTPKKEVHEPNYFKKLEELKTLTAIFDTQIVANDKKYNLAFDLWLHTESTVAFENIAVEIMVWEDYNKFVSHGKKKETLTTSFGTYDLLYGTMKKPEINSEWVYIAFIRTEKRRSGKVDLKELLDFLVSKNYISSQFYISSIEFGTEVLNSKGNILIKKYEVDAD